MKTENRELITAGELISSLQIYPADMKVASYDIELDNSLGHPYVLRSDVPEAEKMVTLFDNLYGRDLRSRLEKLKEECAELIEVIARTPSSSKDGHFDCLIDEMSDVMAVLVHTCDVVHTSPDLLIRAAMKKATKRAEDPAYKDTFNYMCPDCCSPLKCKFEGAYLTDAYCFECKRDVAPEHVKRIKK